MVLIIGTTLSLGSWSFDKKTKLWQRCICRIYQGQGPKKTKKWALKLVEKTTDHDMKQHISICMCIHIYIYINLCSHERACDHMPSPLTCRRMFSLLRDVGSKRGSYRNIKSICELTDLSALTSDHKWKMELRLDRSLLNPLRTMLNRLDPLIGTVSVNRQEQKAQTKEIRRIRLRVLAELFRKSSRAEWAARRRVDGPTPDKPGWVGWELFELRIQILSQNGKIDRSSIWHPLLIKW